MTANFFTDKVAVITGGARNIGKAVATGLVERGAKVVIGDILESEGQETAKELNDRAGKIVAVFQSTDVTKYNDLMALFNLAEVQFGGVDIVFLNAGIPVSHDMLLDSFDDEKDEKLIRVNTLGAIKGTKVAVMHLAKRGGGAIVCTASSLGLDPLDYSGNYNASKAAIVSWTRSFSSLPDICNVRINAVCPHALDTDFLRSFPKLHRSLVTLEGVQMVEMKTVVKATLLLMEDQERNGQTLGAFPGDVIELQNAPNTSKEAEAVVEVKAKCQEEFKQEFEAAVKRYFAK